MRDSPRILIVAEHASAQFGGEAVLPLHYYRELRKRQADVWLLVHARTRDELQRLFPDDPHIHYVEDIRLHYWLWRIQARLPAQLAYITTGFVSRIATQLAQRRVARRLVKTHRINVVHQPIPVSPREPSLMHSVGAPVVMGPMNGGMVFPPAFRRQRTWAERGLYALGIASAALLNRLMPGKRRAALLMVANQRTWDALPAGLCPHVEQVVENGVDLSLWNTGVQVPSPPPDPARPAVFLFMGRLIELKAVDLLLEAFHHARDRAPMQLVIVGDGDDRARLQQCAKRLDLLPSADGDAAPGQVRFAGWLPQPDCADLLASADGLVMPSLRECGGAVVLEAMAMGKPVIATAWGGPLDYLDADCGVLVEPHDREAVISGFAKAMEELALQPDRRARMGRAGQDKIRRHYDWERKAAAMLEIYQRVLDRNRPA
jgi:glycosyltransferase involved in cell wall biosynthesis